MTTQIVSDHEVPNPKIKGREIVPAEFLALVREGRNSHDSFFVDVNAFQYDELAEIARSKTEVVSYFYDWLPTKDLSSLGINAVYWSKTALSNAPKIDEVVNQLEKGEVLPARDLPRKLSGKSNLSPLGILQSSTLLGILAVIAVLCALCGAIVPVITAILAPNEESAFISTLAMGNELHSVTMLIAIVCTIIIVLLRTARGVYLAVKAVTAEGVSPLEKAVRVLVEVVTIELLVFVVSVLLCFYLGVFTAPKGTMLNPEIVANPILNFFVSIGTYSQYLFVLMPRRVIAWVIVPVAVIAFVVAFFLVKGGETKKGILLVLDNFGGVVEAIPVTFRRR